VSRGARRNCCCATGQFLSEDVETATCPYYRTFVAGRSVASPGTVRLAIHTKQARPAACPYPEQTPSRSQLVVTITSTNVLATPEAIPLDLSQGEGQSMIDQRVEASAVVAVLRYFATF